jgi:hypothetical protein
VEVRIFLSSAAVHDSTLIHAGEKLNPFGDAPELKSSPVIKTNSVQ